MAGKIVILAALCLAITLPRDARAQAAPTCPNPFAGTWSGTITDGRGPPFPAESPFSVTLTPAPPDILNLVWTGDASYGGSGGYQCTWSGTTMMSLDGTVVGQLQGQNTLVLAEANSQQQATLTRQTPLATSCPISVVQAGPGQAYVSQSAGDTLVNIDPPVATVYGRTWLPFQVKVTNGNMPAPTVSVTLSPGSGASGITLTPGDPAGSITSLITGPDGLTSTAYLIVEQSAASPIASVSVSASTADGNIAASTWNAVNNLNSIIASYMSTIPVGKTNPTLQAAFTPPLGSSLLWPPLWFDIIDQNMLGAIVCSRYESMVLDFLNRLRYSPQGWLMNGIDYGPATTMNKGHFFVIVWPHSSSFTGSDALVFDPWPAQTPVVYTQADYSLFAPRGYMNDPSYSPCSSSSSPPYPNYPNPAPYPMSGPGCGLSEAPPVKLIVTLHSPVDALFTAPDGGQAGYLASADAGVDDLGDDYERLDFPEDDAGTRGVYMGFVPSSGTLDVIGLESGTFGMDVAYALPDGEPQISRFSSVGVSQGESIHFVLDIANACASGTRATGAQIAPSSPCPLPPPPSSGCGCSISATAGPGEGIATFTLALAVLAWARMRRVHSID